MKNKGIILICNKAIMVTALLAFVTTMIGAVPLPDTFSNAAHHSQALSPASILDKASPPSAKKQKEGKLTEGIMQVAISDIEAAIRKKKEESDEPFIILIGGKSCSGKTTQIAQVLAKHFSCNVLEMDMYYLGRTYMREHGYDSFDIPQVFDLGLLVENIRQLRNRQTARIPVYSFLTKERQGYTDLPPADVLIIEGMFGLDDQLAEQGDYCLFIDIGKIGQLLRRMYKEVIIGRTGHTFRHEIRQLLTQVIPSEKEYIEPTRKNADVIVHNEYNPEVESALLPYTEVQAKINSVNLPAGRLTELGARQLAETQHIDTYYVPIDTDLAQNGETLMIREEDQEMSLTYKGPLIPSELQYRTRLNLPFERDLLPFVHLDYKPVAKIRKTRTTYKLNELIIHLDHVETLGDFIEITTPEPANAGDRDTILELLRTLGISQDRIIKKTYLDLMLEKTPWTETRPSTGERSSGVPSSA